MRSLLLAALLTLAACANPGPARIQPSVTSNPAGSPGGGADRGYLAPGANFQIHR